MLYTNFEYRLIAKVDNLDDYDLSHLHSAVSAGEPLNQKVFEVFQETISRLKCVMEYGQTENTLLVGVTKGMEIKLGSMGKPTPGNHVEIIDDSGKPCSPGVVGILPYMSIHLLFFKEYFKRSRADIAAIPRGLLYHRRSSEKG